MDPQQNQDPQQSAPKTPQQPAAQPPAVPQTPMQQLNQAPASVPGMNSGAAGKKTKRGLFIGLLAGLFLVGGSAAAYVQFVHNSPDRVWSRAMGATAQGFDRMIELTRQEGAAGQKMDGRFSVTSPIAIDGSMDGQWGEGGAQATFDIGAAGFRVNAEMRAVNVEGASNPDLYMKVDGLDVIGSLLGALGGGGLGDDDLLSPEILSQVNDQWFSVDHTLLDQLTEAGMAQATTITPEETNAIVDAITMTMRDTLFTAGDRAVFDVVESYGKEDFEGTATQKYRVGLNPENLKAMFSDLETALQDTKVMELLGLEGVTTIDELLSVDQINEGIDNTDFSGATADVWVEQSGRYVRNVRFYPIEDQKDSNYLDIGIPYEGGDVVPFLLRATIDDDSSKGTLSLGLDVNQSNRDTRLWMDADINAGLLGFVANGEVTIADSDDQASTDAPSDARNIYELLSIFGLDGAEQLLFGPTTPTFDSVPSTTFPLDDIEL